MELIGYDKYHRRNLLLKSFPIETHFQCDLAKQALFKIKHLIPHAVKVSRENNFLKSPAMYLYSFISKDSSFDITTKQFVFDVALQATSEHNNWQREINFELF